MATKMERVIQQAIKCFTRNNKVFSENLQADMAVLRELVDQVSMRDLKFVKYFVQKSQQESTKKARSSIDPVEYLRIYENGDVSIGVFVIKQGAKLPIHDHPSMYGILKVLHGVLKVTNYTIVGKDTSTSVENRAFFHQHALKVVKHPAVTVSDKDSCTTLTPIERSIHEVECVTGPAAFLDILAPPYEDLHFQMSLPRGCHYFKEVENATDDGQVRLLQISEPTYWVEPNEGN